MLKLVFDDYRRSFWTSLKKHIITAEGYFFYTYIIILMAINIEYVNLVSVTGLISMLVGLLLSRIYPNQMSKILFLCPLTEQERKCYLKTAYRFRVCVPMALCLIGSTVAMVFGCIAFFYYFEMNLLVLSYLLGINVYCMPESWKMSKISTDQWTFRVPFAYEFLNIFLQLVGLIGICVFGSVDLNGMEERKDKIAMTVFVLAEILICLKMIVTYYKPVMEHGMKYEDCYPVKSDR